MFSKLFLDDPEGFANQHALVPQGGSEETSKLKTKAGGPDLTHYQVKGANRIMFAKIAPEPGALNRYDLEYNIAQPDEVDWFPIYWLPWNIDQTYRITLKPSNKHTVLTTSGNAVNVRHFFTALLTGCLVHVEGDPQTPTVYHANYMNLKPTKTPPESPDVQKEWLSVQKASEMTGRIADFSSRYPKPAGTAGKSINAFHYQRESATGVGAQQLVEKEANIMGAPTTNDVNITQLGTVFGVKDNAGWSFWYQALTRTIRYAPSRLERWTVNSCKKFWP